MGGTFLKGVIGVILGPYRDNGEENGYTVQGLGFPQVGVPFWGPQNKHYSILRSILGSPYFGKLPKTLFPGVFGLGDIHSNNSRML